MTTYYNEIDKYAAQWLRNLTAAGLIAPGDVDERSITDVKADDLKDYTQCHFFAGIGGWSAALRKAGWPDDYPVWTGSCPCQPFSVAGKQKGFADERHLWPVWFNLISQQRPAIVFGEQVANATPWLGLVRRDMEAVEYTLGAMPIEAASAGAYHRRDRYWFVAHRSGERSSPRLSRPITREEGHTGELNDSCSQEPLANCNKDGCSPHTIGQTISERDLKSRGIVVNSESLSEREPDYESNSISNRRETREISGCRSNYFITDTDGKARRVEPGIRLLADGVSGRVGLLRGFGNAIDPRPAAAFITASVEAIWG